MRAKGQGDVMDLLHMLHHITEHVVKSALACLSFCVVLDLSVYFIL